MNLTDTNQQQEHINVINICCAIFTYFSMPFDMKRLEDEPCLSRILINLEVYTSFDFYLQQLNHLI